MDDLYQLCSEALEKCQGVKLSMGDAVNNFNPPTTRTPKPTEHMGNSERMDRDPDTPNEKKPHAPKSGVSLEEHVQKLKILVDFIDHCGYCYEK